MILACARISYLVYFDELFVLSPQLNLLTILQLPPCVPELNTGSQATLSSLKLGMYSDV